MKDFLFDENNIENLISITLKEFEEVKENYLKCYYNLRNTVKNETSISSKLPINVLLEENIEFEDTLDGLYSFIFNEVVIVKKDSLIEIFLRETTNGNTFSLWDFEYNIIYKVLHYIIEKKMVYVDIFTKHYLTTLLSRCNDLYNKFRIVSEDLITYFVLSSNNNILKLRNQLIHINLESFINYEQIQLAYLYTSISKNEDDISKINVYINVRIGQWIYTYIKLSSVTASSLIFIIEKLK